GIDLRRALACPLGDDIGEGIDGRFGHIDPCQRRLDDGARLDLAAGDGARDLGRRRGFRERIAHGRKTGAGVSSSSSSTASRAWALASDRSRLRITLARYSGAIGKPIALASSSTQRAMSGLSSATVPPLSRIWRRRKEYANERPMTIDLGVHNLGAAY